MVEKYGPYDIDNREIILNLRNIYWKLPDYCLSFGSKNIDLRSRAVGKQLIEICWKPFLNLTMASRESSSLLIVTSYERKNATGQDATIQYMNV